MDELHSGCEEANTGHFTFKCAEALWLGSAEFVNVTAAEELADLPTQDAQP